MAKNVQPLASVTAPQPVLEVSKEMALCEAAAIGDNKRVSELLSARANPTTWVPNPNSTVRMNSIVLAAQNGHCVTLCILLRFLKNMAEDLNKAQILPKEKIESECNILKSLALHSAVDNADVNIVQVLLGSGNNVNPIMTDGKAPIMPAASFVNLTMTDGKTPIMLAASLPKFWTPEKEMTDPNTLLEAYETIFKLLAEKTELSYSMPGKDNILHFILRTGTQPMLSHLLEKTKFKADFTTQESKDSLKILLERNDEEADVCISYLMGWAAYTGNIELLEIFNREIICPNATDDEGEKLLIRAIQGQQPETVAWLLDRGAYVNEHCKENGESALNIAVMLGALPTVQLLLKDNAYVSEQGEIVHSLARNLQTKNKTEIQSLLLCTKIRRIIQTLSLEFPDKKDLVKKWLKKNLTPLLVKNLLILDITFTSDGNLSLEAKNFIKGSLPVEISQNRHQHRILLTSQNLIQILLDYSSKRNEDNEGNTNLNTKEKVKSFEKDIHRTLWIRSEQGVRNFVKGVELEAQKLQVNFLQIRTIALQLIKDISQSLSVVEGEQALALEYLEEIKTQNEIRTVKPSRSGKPRNSLAAQTTLNEKEKSEIKTFSETLGALKNTFEPLWKKFDKYYTRHHEEIAYLFYSILEEESPELPYSSLAAVNKHMKFLEDCINQYRSIKNDLQFLHKKIIEKTTQYKEKIIINTKKVQQAKRKGEIENKEAQKLEALQKKKALEEKQKLEAAFIDKVQEEAFIKARQEALKKFKEKHAAEKEAKKKELDAKKISEGKLKSSAIGSPTDQQAQHYQYSFVRRHPKPQPLTLESATQLTSRLQMENKKVLLEKILKCKWVSESSKSPKQGDAKESSEKLNFLLRLKRNAILCTLAQMMETILERKGGHWFPIDIAHDIRNFIFHVSEDNALLKITEENITQIQKMAIELQEYLAGPHAEITGIQDNHGKIKAVKTALKSTLFHAIILEMNKTRLDKMIAQPHKKEDLDKKVSFKKPTFEEFKMQIASCKKEEVDYRLYQNQITDAYAFEFQAAYDFTIARKGAIAADFMKNFPKEYAEYLKAQGGWRAQRGLNLAARIIRHNKPSETGSQPVQLVLYSAAAAAAGTGGASPAKAASAAPAKVATLIMSSEPDDNSLRDASSSGYTL